MYDCHYIYIKKKEICIYIIQRSLKHAYFDIACHFAFERMEYTLRIIRSAFSSVFEVDFMFGFIISLCGSNLTPLGTMKESCVLAM